MAMTSKIIHTKAATIQTLAVEVKALKIGPKQVTQAVFCQLPKNALIDPDTGELRGIPWGNVNYFWGNCGSNHLHTVWQQGERLYRDCVYSPQDSLPDAIQNWRNVIAKLGKEIMALAETYVLLRIRENPMSFQAKIEQSEPLQEKVTWPTGVSCHVNVDRDAAGTCVRTFCDPSWRQRRSLPGKGKITWRDETEEEWRDRLVREEQKALAALDKAIIERLEAYYADPLALHPEDLYEQSTRLCTAWEAAKAQEKRLREVFHAQYAAIAALDQLFIAV